MRQPKTILLAILALVAGLATAWGKYPKSYIVNSAHDLSHDTWSSGKPPSTSVCYFCHIMHKTGAGPITTMPGYLLWNHELSAHAAYGVYSSDSFNALLTGGVTITDLGIGAYTSTSTLTTSNLCLSCHDGTVAVAYFYMSPSFLGLPTQGATTGATTATGFIHLIISDLTRSHPVNFTYNSTLVTNYGAGLATPTSSSMVDAAGEIPLYSGLMQCTTCHDVHDGVNSTPFPFPRNFSGTTPFCTTCHT